MIIDTEGCVNGAKAFCDFMKTQDYDVRLEYGSLLGCVRGGQIIEGDSDIDLCIHLKSSKKEDLIQEIRDLIWLLKKKSLLFKVFTKNSMVMAFDIDDISQIGNPGGQLHLVAPIYSKSTGPIFLDVFTSWVGEDGNYYLCRFGSMGKAEDLYPYKTSLLNGVEFLVPKTPEVILEALYGDWQTPRKEVLREGGPQRSWWL
jgi:hypothetical protein